MNGAEKLETFPIAIFYQNEEKPFFSYLFMSILNFSEYWRMRGTYFNTHIYIHHNIFIYSYFAGKLKNFYFTEGSRDHFGMQNITSVVKDILQAKLVKVW